MAISREQLDEIAEAHGLEIFAYDVTVHGTTHRKSEVADYIRGVIATQKSGNDDDTYGVELEREPENEHDPSAIKVFGTWELSGQDYRRHIGYVPRKLAFKIEINLDDEPLHAFVSSINNNDEGSFDIVFHIAIHE